MSGKQEKWFNRRRFLAAAGSVTAGALAGCTDLIQRRFEAKPYVLPAKAQKDLFLGEVVRTSESIRHNPEVGPISGKITIVNHVSGYTRANAVSQALGESDGIIAESGSGQRFLGLMDRWIRGVNGTEGVGSAVVAPAKKLGLDEANPGSLETSGGEPITVPGARISVVIPAQAREDDVSLAEMMALQLGSSFNVDQLTLKGQSNWIVNLGEFWPGPVPDSIPVWPGAPTDLNLDANGFSEDTRCLVCLGDDQSSKQTFGIAPANMPGDRLEEGQRVDLTENMVVAVPAPKEFPGVTGPFDWPQEYIPAALGGSTFGVGVFSTPAAVIGGQSLNPVSPLGLREILTLPQTGGVLREAGVTDAQAVEWLQGPEEVTIGGRTPFTIELLGKETELKTFGGVVSGDVGPWGVAVHMTRVKFESDIVIGAGVQRTPVGEGVASGGGGDTPANFLPGFPANWVPAGQAFTGRVMAAGWKSLGGDSGE